MRVDNSPINEYDKYRLVGEVSHILCNICNKIYIPDDSDISLSPSKMDASFQDLNGNFYYKNCKGCRAHRLEIKRRYEAKKRAKLPPLSS